MENSEVPPRIQNLELGKQRSSSAEYAELRRLLEQEGLFASQPFYYVGVVSMVLIALAASLTLLMSVKLFALQLLNAVFLGLIFCQLSYVVHDAGHGQIFRSSRRNHLLGTLVTNLILGMSYGYWRESHNRHHANPNQVDLDPDIEVSLMAFTEEQARTKMGLSRFITMYQAYLFVPMLFFDSFRRRKESIQFLFRKKAMKEIVLVIAHYVLIAIFLFSVFAIWKAILFFLIQQASYGLFVALVFAPNHKGMPLLPKDVEMDFLRRQVITTRNVRSNPFIDFWSGALNHQIEHHLFPNMPRNNLKASRRFVREFCAAHGIAYTETSAFDSFRQTLSYLHRVSGPLRLRVSNGTKSC